MRLFAGDRIYKILDKLKPVSKEGEEEPIEAKMLSKQIENAQKKVEEQNFLIRKRVLEYDDVMNQQREIIYEYRDRILGGPGHVRHRADLDRGRGRAGLPRVPRRRVAEDWDLERALHPARAEPVAEHSFGAEDIEEGMDRETLVEEVRKDVVDAYNELQEELGDELMRALERFMLLQIIDERWREHLHDMDYLREGIHLRGFAQIDPLVAYKNEGFEMFTTLEQRLGRVRSLHLQRRGRGRRGAAARAAVVDGRQQHQLLQLRGRLRRRRQGGHRGRGRRGDELPEGVADAADLAAGEVLAQPIMRPSASTSTRRSAATIRARRLRQEVQEAAMGRSASASATS